LPTWLERYPVSHYLAVTPVTCGLVGGSLSILRTSTAEQFVVSNFLIRFPGPFQNHVL
jgi:hypothetical protein